MNPGHGHGNHVVTAAGHEHERVVPPAPAPDDPGPEEVEKAGGLKHPVFRMDGGSWVRVPEAKNPSPKGSFGYVGTFGEVGEKGHEKHPHEGTLVFPVPGGARLGGVARDTLRIFRWEETARAWRLLPRTAPGVTRDYVWGRVPGPGLYGLIGVHADPLIARTLALHAALRGFLEAPDRGFRSALADKLCGLLLCDPEARKRLEDPRLYRAIVEDNRRLGLPGVWMPAPHGEKPQRPPLPEVDPCAICRETAGGPAAPPPETALFALSITTSASVGEWSVFDPTPAPDNDVLPVHAALLRTGRILYFGGSENVGAQNAAGGAAIDNTRLFDPAAGTLARLTSPPRYDLFCCGHAFLGDGRLLAAGGTKGWGGVEHPGHGTNFEGLRSAAIFEPAAPAGFVPWTPVERLRPQRGQTRGGGAWYPTLATLPDGKVLRMGGPPEYEDSRRNNRTLELFDPETGDWTDQGAAADIPASDVQDLPQYPRLHVLPGGRLFCATPIEGPAGGPGWRSWRWDPGSGAWSSVGAAGPGGEFVGFDTSSILLPLKRADNYRARVLYTNRADPKIIDLSLATPAWSSTSPRALSDPVSGPPIRYHATSVLLADGSVLVVGGHSDPNNWDPPVLDAEHFDPETGTWSVAATAAVPRVYHSVALLLPDGRVWTAGSDYGNGVHETRMEYYSPPYLFRGARPVISAAPDVITVGTRFTVATPDAAAIATAALVRCGTATHAYSIDQRWLDLGIEAVAPGALTLEAPPHTRVAPPGYYMLFLLDGDGVPSVAKILRVQADARPTVSGLYPRSGPGAGGTAVTILGTNFQAGASVTFGGAPGGAATVVSETELTVIAPALPAGALYDVVVTNPDLSSRTLPRGWMADFLDVPAGHLFHDVIGRLFRSGVTAGCGGGNFCPDDPVTRAQMAVFLVRAEHGTGWAAPVATGATYTDVPAGAFGAAAIEQAAAEGVFAAGGAFGPNVPVSRAEMARLLLKAEHGPTWAPPAAAGIFGDVPAGDAAAPWIERLFREGITAGCGGGNFCPNDTSTRAQMAAFLVRTFGLP